MTPPDGGPVPVVLSLGSNVGDREAMLRRAVAALSATVGITVLARSRIVQTAPVGGPEQGDYLNAVVLAETTLAPMQLLEACRQIEADQQRTREVRWGPRTLDIDVITYGQLVDDDERLTLPHPRAHERGFVLLPWSQVDPQAQLPGPQGGPVSVLAARAPDRLTVHPYLPSRPTLDELAELLDDGDRP